MNMQTGRKEETGLPAQNFTVLALQRKVFARSNIGILAINKDAVSYDPLEDTSKPVYSRYNRNLGIEYNLASSNNLWTGKALLFKSFSPGSKTRDLVHAGNLQYSSRKWTLNWQHEYVGRNYNAEVGYTPRRGYIKANILALRNFFPKRGKILSHGPRITSFYYFDESFKRTDNEVVALYLLTFRTQAVLSELRLF
jgi:hypothetical protein